MIVYAVAERIRHKGQRDKWRITREFGVWCKLHTDRAGAEKQLQHMALKRHWVIVEMEVADDGNK